MLLYTQKKDIDRGEFIEGKCSKRPGNGVALRRGAPGK